MDLSIVYAACAVVGIGILAFVAVALVRTLRSTQETLARLDRTMEKLEPSLVELQSAMREVRSVSEQVSEGISSVRRVTSRLGGASEHALDVGSLFFQGSVVGRVLAVAQAVRAGAQMFLRRGRERQASGADPGNGRPEAD